MKFTEALINFKHALATEYGVTDGIVKIALEPDLFTAVMIDLYRKHNNTNYMSFAVRDVGEAYIENVQLLQRTRDKF